MRNSKMFGKGDMRRILGIVLALVMCLGSVSAFAGEAVYGAIRSKNSDLYSDLSRKHWAYEEVALLNDKEIISGYPDGSFRPGRTVTYGEFVKMVYAGCAEKAPQSAKKGEHWAAPYYFAALAEDYFKDDVISEGMLSKEIPRKHMAHIAAEVIGGFEPLNESESRDYELFTDISEISEHSFDIMTASLAGILEGYEDGSFGPDRTLTRAEAAVVITRLLDYKEEHEGEALPDKESEERESDAKYDKTDEVIVRKAETASGTVPVNYDVYKGKMSDMGIRKVEKVSENTINIYSDIKHDFVFIMLSDGTFLAPVGFPEGSSTIKDGFHLYVADPKGRSLEGETLYFMFEDGNRVFVFEDLTL